MKKRETEQPEKQIALNVSPKYGFSFRHDKALELCIASHRTCPTGCVKDGAPNCYAHVVGVHGIEQCQFGKLTAQDKE